MTNQLCSDETPDCLGFNAGNASCPSAEVVCLSGTPVVQNWTSAKAYAASAGETLNAPMATASLYNATDLTIDMVNPWCVEALVWVSHEFGIGVTVSDTDQWSMNGDVSIVGGVLFTGGTTGQFNFQGRDGTAYANDDTLVPIDNQHAFELLYVVAAGASFSITQHARFEAIDIRGGIGGGRIVGTFTDAMRCLILPRQT